MITVVTYYDGQVTYETFRKGKTWSNENGFLRIFGKNKIIAEYAPGSWGRVYCSK